MFVYSGRDLYGWFSDCLLSLIYTLRILFLGVVAFAHLASVM